MKKALIIGVTGQDGSYLAEYLLKQEYQVHGIKRRSSSINTERINHIYGHPRDLENKVQMHYGDILDGGMLTSLFKQIQPDECYNLAAQSHVGVSFEIPEYTLETNSNGALKVLQAIKNVTPQTKLYNACSSEIFGNYTDWQLLSEDSPKNPVSPYAAAKLLAFNLTKIYREAFGIYAASGILFNHESPRRGETFVSQKIVKGLTRIFLRGEGYLYLGNLNAKRDWGHANDYVKAMHLMLQKDFPEDYVVSTGHSHSVREFVQEVCKTLGEDVEWRGEAHDEKLYSKSLARDVLSVDQRYFRPLEVNYLQGDSSKIRNELGWKPEYDFQSLVKEMVDFERQKYDKS